MVPKVAGKYKEKQKWGKKYMGIRKMEDNSNDEQEPRAEARGSCSSGKGGDVRSILNPQSHSELGL